MVAPAFLVGVMGSKAIPGFIEDAAHECMPALCVLGGSAFDAAFRQMCLHPDPGFSIDDRGMLAIMMLPLVGDHACIEGVGEQLVEMAAGEGQVARGSSVVGLTQALGRGA